MNEFTIDLYKDKWVVCPFVEIAGGRGYHDSPLVTIIEHDDKEKLIDAVRTILEQDISVVEPEAFYSSLDPLGIRPKAVNDKSANAYFRDTRCFYLFKKDEQIKLEEWEKARGHWIAKPVWKKTFSSSQLEYLISYLIKKTEPSQKLGKKKDSSTPKERHRQGRTITALMTASLGRSINFKSSSDPHNTTPNLPPAEAT